MTARMGLVNAIVMASWYLFKCCSAKSVYNHAIATSIQEAAQHLATLRMSNRGM